MTIQILTPIGVAQQQLDSYNRNGPANQSNSFDLPANKAWAVVGTLVDNTVVVGDIPTIQSAIEGLAEVGICEALHWGQAPSEILVNSGGDTHETVLIVSAVLDQTIDFGTGAGQNTSTKLVPATQIKPPLNKKFVVWVMSVPSELNQAGIAILTAAIAGSHADITLVKHLLDGITDAETAGSSKLTVASHTRIDLIPA